MIPLSSRISRRNSRPSVPSPELGNCCKRRRGPGFHLRQRHTAAIVLLVHPPGHRRQHLPGGVRIVRPAAVLGVDLLAPRFQQHLDAPLVQPHAAPRQTGCPRDRPGTGSSTAAGWNATRPSARCDTRAGPASRPGCGSFPWPRPAIQAQTLDRPRETRCAQTCPAWALVQRLDFEPDESPAPRSTLPS